MKALKNILFWGAAWGILEATLGWGLHLIHFKGEALILYPFGLACMLAAIRQIGGGAETALKVAGVAALVKLVNLITWPNVPLYYVINPAIAIFLEGLVTFVFFAATQRRKERATHFSLQFWMAFMLVLGSFFIFKAWQMGMDRMTVFNPDAHLFLSGEMIWKWIWRSAVQGLMLMGAVNIAIQWQPSAKWQIETNRWSVPMLAMAVLATLYL